jgi:protein-tyrosine kinase
MSRDFELLQRLEQGWNRSLNLRGPIDGKTPIAEEKPPSEIAQTRVATATLPAAHLTPAVRNELNKLILRTFLSTPAVKVIMFTGVEAQEDAKWVTSCTADVLAHTTHDRVCLLDADLAFPTVHRAYSVSNQNGLAAVLRGSCSIGSATIRAAENLWVVPAGTSPQDEQMTAVTFQEVVVDLLEHFEYLVVSAPDCDRLAELGVVGAAADGAVLVLDAMTTHRKAAQDAKAALEIAKIRIMGSVFTNQSSPVPDFLHAHM